MKNLFVIKRFSIIALFAVFSVGLTYAENNTFFAKARARVGSTGEGKVYASANRTNNPDYTEAGNAVTKNQNNNTDFTFYMYAEADPGYDFTGWSTAANGSSLLSNSDVSPYSYRVSSNAESDNDATENNLYAIFRPLPTFYFSATAVVVPNGAGTVSVSPTTTSVYGEHWSSTSANTNAITFTATSGANHVFQGWSKTESGEIESSANSYKPTITSNSTNSGSPSNTTLYARFLPYPTGVTASPASMILGEGDSETINAVVNPSGSYSNIGFESNNTSVATVNANGVVTAVSEGEAIILVKALKSDGVTVIATASVSVSVIEKCANPVIVFEPSSDGKTATTTLSTTTENASIYYTIDGGEPSTSSTLYTGPFNVSNGQIVRAITVKPGCKESKVTTSTFVAEKVALPSIEIASTGVSFSCETPGVSYYYTTNGDTPTTSSTQWNSTPITGLGEGVTIKVIATKSGMITSDMATKTYYPASGVSGTTVTLNDLEDHNWTYYSGVNTSVDGGNYNTQYAGKLYSPNPRNVKITYNGVNGISGSATNVRVSISENESAFVYYKTLEQGNTNGEYPYQVISNPFSVRPSTGSGNSKVYYGFNGWKIISGGEYIKDYNNGQILPLDAEIVFENLPYPNINCISADIVFETTWKKANRTYVSSNPGSNQTYDTNGDYESNFYVINCGYTRTITASQPVTIMMVEPDGSDDYRNSNTFTGNITPDNTGVTKIEFARWTPNGNINAAGRSLTIGRGMNLDGSSRTVYGLNTQNIPVNQVVKIESGVIKSFYHYGAYPSSITKQIIVFGNDYDRANSDDTKLDIRELCKISYQLNLRLSDTKTMMCKTYSKSGKIMSQVKVGNAATENVYYYSPDGSQTNYNGGCRYLEIQGGEWCCIAGGFDNYHEETDPAFTFRMKGGKIRGSLYGAGEFYSASGIRSYVLTGGTINGWIAAGANGTRSDGGKVSGSSYMYVGGNARIDSEGSNDVINRAVGGNVFGAGCGYSAESTSGEVTNGTNVVIADEAYVERGVYGGGSYGYTTASSYLYITGGHVAGKNGGVNSTTYDESITGGIFGGSCQNKGGSSYIYMTGGKVEGGVYGGSNAKGSFSGGTTLQINGGQVGTSSQPANIHGGGYGQSTIVSGNVEVTLGTAGQSTGGVTVYGDVYGGSALGKVNTNTNNTTKVKLTGGIIHGDAYGGGLGARGIAADVNGNVTVTLDGTAFVLATTTDDNGNTIPTSGRVFGCNNINGSPKGTVLVKVLKTVARDGEGNVKTKPAEKNSGIYELEAVYGGGNLAAYNPTNSKATGQYTYRFNSETYGEVNFTAVEKPVQVVIDGCGLTSIEYVYGGGNAAATPATDVLVLGSYEIGNVFGGGNGKDRYTLDGGTTWNENPGADVGIIDTVAYKQNTANGKYGTGKSKASVLGGTVHNLFGASNTKGNVVSESLAYVDNANICDLNVGGIYGGGNEAYMDGDSKIELGCIEAMEEIYGGARNADVKGDINLTISSGHFDRVFGGNNIGGTINGSITVTIEETGCNPITIGELYGCGNQAPYTTPEGEDHPIINLISFTSIGNVFGGGFGEKAVVKGNPTVNINVTSIGANANRENWSYNGSTIDFGSEYIVQLPVHEKGKIGVIGTVYGGGNAAAVIGNTTVNMKDGIVENTLFGGGNAADVEGSTSVTILDGTIGGNVYGGGNKGHVTGTTKVQIGEQPTP